MGREGGKPPEPFFRFKGFVVKYTAVASTRVFFEIALIHALVEAY